MDTLAPSSPWAVVGEFFAVIARGRSYLNLLYLWLAFPLGLLYFVFLSVSVPLGLGLTIIWVGFGILLVALLSTWAFVRFERLLAHGLLGVDLPTSVPTEPRVGVLAWLWRLVSTSPFWRGLVFVALKFPLGLGGWVVSVVSLSISLAFLFAPLAHALGGSVDLGVWRANTSLDAWWLMPVGALLVVVTLHLHNAMAWLWSKLSQILLAPAPVGATSANG